VSAADEIRAQLRLVLEDLRDAVQPEITATLEAMDDALELHAEMLDALDKARAMSLHLAQRFSALGGDILVASGDIPQGGLFEAMNVCGLAYTSADETAELIVTIAQQEYLKLSMTQAKGVLNGLGVYARTAIDQIEGELPK
jgi:hypothetical protein